MDTIKELKECLEILNDEKDDKTIFWRVVKAESQINFIIRQLELEKEFKTDEAK